MIGLPRQASSIEPRSDAMGAANGRRVLGTGDETTGCAGVRGAVWTDGLETLEGALAVDESHRRGGLGAGRWKEV